MLKVEMTGLLMDWMGVGKERSQADFMAFNLSN